MKPNIFLLTIDSVRADRFYGPKKSAITPNFDHIIRNGLFFTHCITPSAQTGTSLASIFTGKYPVSSGVTQHNFNFDFTTFFDELEKLGYNLYSCVTDLLMLKKITKNFKHNLEYVYSGANSYPHLDNDLGPKILKNFLNKKMDEPWMFYCHLMDLKDPTVSTKNFDDKKFGKTAYDKNLSVLDTWIGKFLEYIDLTNTLFVITTDHGEYVRSTSSRLEKSIRKISEGGKKFGFLESIGKKPFSTSIKFARKMQQKQAENLEPSEKRNYFLKRDGAIFDDLVKVPLLLIGYGIKEPKIISSQVRHVDIFPTIFELIGLPITNSSIDGKSCVSTYKGIESDELTAYIESASNDPKKSGAVIGVRTLNYKYFRSRYDSKKNVNLYDLQKDPKEEHNILNAELIKKMEEKLSYFIEKSKSVKENKINEDEEAELEKELQKMGYID
jgi:arylsulfatase A-like enzyme